MRYQEISARIVKALLTMEGGEQGHRLAIMKKRDGTEVHLGGRCREAAETMVRAVIEEFVDESRLLEGLEPVGLGRWVQEGRLMKSKDMCVGCRDDYYNHNREEGCWMFDNARIVTRVRVGTWEPPPYSPKRAKKYLSCFHADGSAMLDMDDCRVKEGIGG